MIWNQASLLHVLIAVSLLLSIAIADADVPALRQPPSLTRPESNFGAGTGNVEACGNCPRGQVCCRACWHREPTGICSRWEYYCDSSCSSSGSDDASLSGGGVAGVVVAVVFIIGVCIFVVYKCCAKKEEPNSGGYTLM